MTGWRLGYAAGPTPLIKAMTNLQSQSTSNPSTISQYAALEALNTPRDSFLPNWIATYKNNRDLAFDTIKKINGLDVTKPGGAFYLLVGCEKFMGSVLPDGKKVHHPDDISYYLLHEAKVGVVPGSAFGYDHSFRISYAIDPDILKEALVRIKDAFDRIQLFI
jgi:aspartate aminotransferase